MTLLFVCLRGHCLQTVLLTAPIPLCTSDSSIPWKLLSCCSFLLQFPDYRRLHTYTYFAEQVHCTQGVQSLLQGCTVTPVSICIRCNGLKSTYDRFFRFRTSSCCTACLTGGSVPWYLVPASSSNLCKRASGRERSNAVVCVHHKELRFCGEWASYALMNVDSAAKDVHTVPVVPSKCVPKQLRMAFTKLLFHWNWYQWIRVKMTPEDCQQISNWHMYRSSEESLARHSGACCCTERQLMEELQIWSFHGSMLSHPIRVYNSWQAETNSQRRFTCAHLHRVKYHFVHNVPFLLVPDKGRWRWAVTLATVVVTPKQWTSFLVVQCMETNLFTLVLPFLDFSKIMMYNTAKPLSDDTMRRIGDELLQKIWKM